MTEAADPPAFHCRRDDRDTAALWTLGRNELVRTGADGTTQRMAYAEVKELRLSVDSERTIPQRFRCDLHSAAGHRVTLVSKSFIAPNTYEDRASSYTPFVRELIRRIAVASPDCRFAAGQTPWSFYGGHAVALAGLLVVAHLVARWGALPPNASLTLKVVMIIAYVAVAIRSAPHRRPRRFAPQDIPASLLP
jgi:hypothetical protein